jgi:hypothetical protein
MWRLVTDMAASPCCREMLTYPKTCAVPNTLNAVAADVMQLPTVVHAVLHSHNVFRHCCALMQGTGYVDWLYLDEGLRVTRGSKGSLFVHAKDNEAKL